MTVITLLTDFGEKDGYPGIMKGVIYRISPTVSIVDLTHLIAPQSILEGAITLARAYSYFPTGTIHCIVVDPGVGCHRRALAGRIGDYFFVCPDNGLLTIPYEQAIWQHKPIQLFHLDQPQYWLSSISSVFHGRDIFAPTAAHLANGVALKALGSPISDPVLLEIPQPVACDFGWRGQIIHIDAFGNLATNILRQHLDGLGGVQVAIGDQIIPHLSQTYADGQTGTLVGLIDSANYLSICVVNGSAQNLLGARIGDPVEVYPLSND